MRRYHVFTLLLKQMVRVPLPLREGGGTVGHKWSVEGSSFAIRHSENPLDAFQCLLIARLRRRRERVLFQVRSQCWHPAKAPSSSSSPPITAPSVCLALGPDGVWRRSAAARTWRALRYQGLNHIGQRGLIIQPGHGIHFPPTFVLISHLTARYSKVRRI